MTLLSHELILCHTLYFCVHFLVAKRFVVPPGLDLRAGNKFPSLIESHTFIVVEILFDRLIRE